MKNYSLVIIVMGIVLGILLTFLLVRGCNKLEPVTQEKQIELQDILRQLQDKNAELLTTVLNEMLQMNAATIEELKALGEQQAAQVDRVISYNRQIRTEIRDIASRREKYETEVLQLHELAKQFPEGNQ